MLNNTWLINVKVHLKLKKEQKLQVVQEKLRSRRVLVLLEQVVLNHLYLRGGGTIFGPRPSNYGFKLNKKLKSLARKSALSYKAQNGGLIVLEDFSFDAPKTKEFKSLLENLKVNEKKSLIVLSDLNKNIYLSSRNLKNTKVVTASGLNTYDLMNASNVLISEGSLETIQTILS